MEVSEKIKAFYEEYEEATRLLEGLGKLELRRTQEIVERYLPRPPAVVLDVGGGPGVYSCWLAEEGYEVHLIDPVPRHVEQAKRASGGQPDTPIASCSVGDARRLNFPNDSADAVLLMGPLYHLTEKNDRLAVLSEATRVLKCQGILFAAGISRFASTIDGFDSGYIQDSNFVGIVERDLEDGQHRNPTDNPMYFTTAFFHRPEALRSEIEEAGFSDVHVVAVEGLGCLMKDFDTFWEDEARREWFLDTLRSIEKEPSILGASPHLLAVAYKGNPPKV